MKKLLKYKKTMTPPTYLKLLKVISNRTGNPAITKAVKRKTLKTRHEATKYEKKKVNNLLDRLGSIDTKSARKKAIK